MTATSGRVRANGIDLAYDAFGHAGDPPIVLVMGLGSQRLAWPDELCEELARAGHHVVRFDNRDVGESTHLDHLPVPSNLDVVLRRTPYRLDDMADDVAGLMDGLGLADAHVVGASMGGFISQTVAIRHPDRVRTLTLIMTSTGSQRVGRPHPAIVLRLARRTPARSREEAIEATIETFGVIGSRGYPRDEAWMRELAGIAYDRGYDFDGFRRQLAAVVAQPDRTKQLRRLQVPTLVVHGLDDKLVHPSGGLALARAIPRSTFVGFSGMGHDLPRPLWPALAREILALTGARERSAAAA